MLLQMFVCHVWITISVHLFSPASLLQTCLSNPRNSIGNFCVLLIELFSKVSCPIHPLSPHYKMPTATLLCRNFFLLIQVFLVRKVFIPRVLKAGVRDVGEQEDSFICSNRKEFPVEKDESYTWLDLNEEFEEDYLLYLFWQTATQTVLQLEKDNKIVTFL